MLHNSRMHVKRGFYFLLKFNLSNPSQYFYQVAENTVINFYKDSLPLLIRKQSWILGTRVLTQSSKQLDAEGGKDEEEEEEEKTKVANLGQGLNHGVQKSPDAFSHFQKLQH